MQNIKNKAFTLIELLVVVAIISLLSSVVIVSLQDSREKAAIAKLKEQTRQIQTALELYRSTNNAYPLGYDDSEQIEISDLVTILNAYIEQTTLETSQIRSYIIEDITYYNNNADGVQQFSCDGFNIPPYFIYASMSGGNPENDFRVVTDSDGLDVDGYYCLSTPI